MISIESSQREVRAVVTKRTTDDGDQATIGRLFLVQEQIIWNPKHRVQTYNHHSNQNRNQHIQPHTSQNQRYDSDHK